MSFSLRVEVDSTAPPCLSATHTHNITSKCNHRANRDGDQKESQLNAGWHRRPVEELNQTQNCETRNKDLSAFVPKPLKLIVAHDDFKTSLQFCCIGVLPMNHDEKPSEASVRVTVSVHVCASMRTRTPPPDSALPSSAARPVSTASANSM